jgi:hypothetical protein
MIIIDPNHRHFLSSACVRQWYLWDHLPHFFKKKNTIYALNIAITIIILSNILNYLVPTGSYQEKFRHDMKRKIVGRVNSYGITNQWYVTSESTPTRASLSSASTVLLYSTLNRNEIYDLARLTASRIITLRTFPQKFFDKNFSLFFFVCLFCDILTTSHWHHVTVMGKYIKANATPTPPRLFDSASATHNNSLLGAKILFYYDNIQKSTLWQPCDQWWPYSCWFL